MKRSLVQNLSINTLQLVVNQSSGLLIFYVLSTHLDKNNFGQINLVLAILLAVFNILSFGIDQLVIKKISGGEDAQVVLSLYCLHVLLTGLVFYTLLLLGYQLFAAMFTPFKLLLFIGAGKLFMYWSNPFKQVANGLERFKLLAGISVVSNVIRALGLIGLLWMQQLSMYTVIIVFIVGDVAECMLSALFFKLKIRIGPLIKWDKRAYINLFKAALPQAGVVIITSALARFDWIFIGLVTSPLKLAEYSFAYKVYELSTLPLLALAPLLIPRFTKMFKDNTFNLAGGDLLIRMEMIIAALTILVLNVCWSPLMDGFTAGKYGLVNQRTIFVLSLSIPFIYLNNFLWTMYFAQGHLKIILKSFILAVCINITLDVILIPFYKNEGAALSLLISLVSQCVFYIKHNGLRGLNQSFYAIVFCTSCAVISNLAAGQLSVNISIQLPVAIGLFILLIIITRQARLKDIRALCLLLNIRGY